MIGVVIEETKENPKPDEQFKIYGWTMVSVLGLCPLLFALVLWKNRFNLDDTETEQKIGAMYTGLIASKPKSGFYVVVFLLRRSAFVFATFWLYRHPELQVLQMSLLTLLYICFIC